jgi:phospholipid transport system substrate-binding protein
MTPTFLPGRRRLAAALAGLALAIAGAAGARAQEAGASALVRQFADALVQVVNGPGGTAQKAAQLRPVIERYVDVPAIARFCLGRFWNTATPAQRSTYQSLFGQVLLENIEGHVGEYQGVTYRLGEAQPRGGVTYVATVINRPNAPPANVQWVVSGGKVIDVVAEGISLRTTQRSDYESFLSRNGGSIDALISALQRKAGQG